MSVSARHYQQIEYHQDSSILFEKIRHLPYAVFLDSCQPFNHFGRYDILTASPFLIIKTQGKTTRLYYKNEVVATYDDPFLILKEQLAKYPAVTAPVPLPFHGGAIGLFGYDLLHHIETITEEPRQDDIYFADLLVGLYDWAYIVDHELKVAHFIHAGHVELPDNVLDCHVGLRPPRNDGIPRHCEEAVGQRGNPDDNQKNREPYSITSLIQSNFTQQTYHQAFNQVQEHIKAGDCYQINLAQRFHTTIEGSCWELYKQLRQRNSAPFSAYLNYPDSEILSFSPERFIQVVDKTVTTKPIKGTRPRGKTNDEDTLLATELINSEKDRAENLMIVDLLRNDLGKTCSVGSIKVPELFALESYPAVHHLVSTVTGELADNYHAIDVLRNAFPGGSITGAPKVRAMQIIESLEPHRRHVYCGAIGYIDYNGTMDTNITIRTLLHQQNNLYFWAGGGIVADSAVQNEYQETFDKVAKILACLS